MTTMTPHEFNNQWGRLCSSGLHILIGTGIDKPLSSRVQHSLSQLTFLEKEVANDKSWNLLERINGRTGRAVGQPWSEIAQAIASLDDRELRMLARDLADFFLVTFAEERDSKRSPGGGDPLQVF